MHKVLNWTGLVAVIFAGLQAQAGTVTERSTLSCNPLQGNVTPAGMSFAMTNLPVLTIESFLVYKEVLDGQKILDSKINLGLTTFEPDGSPVSHRLEAKALPKGSSFAVDVDMRDEKSAVQKVNLNYQVQQAAVALLASGAEIKETYRYDLAGGTFIIDYMITGEISVRAAREDGVYSPYKGKVHCLGQFTEEFVMGDLWPIGVKPSGH